MDAPSMVQRSGDKFIVRSVVSGDQLFVDSSGNKRHKAAAEKAMANNNNNNNNDSDEDTVNDLVINEDVNAEQDIDEEEEEEEEEQDDEEGQSSQQPQSQDDDWREQLVKANLMQFMNQNLNPESLRMLLFNNNNYVMPNKNILDASSDDSAAAMAAMMPKSEAAGDSSNLPQCKIKRNYSCSNCAFFTQNPRLYLVHLRDTHGEKLIIHECKRCIYASRHYQKLVRHMKMVHGLSVDQDGSHLAIRKRGGGGGATASGPSLQQQQQQFQSQLLLNHLVAATSAKRAKSSSAGSSVGADEINNNSVEMSSSGEGAKGGPSSNCTSSRSSRSELINTPRRSEEDQMAAKKRKMDNDNNNRDRGRAGWDGGEGPLAKGGGSAGIDDREVEGDASQEQDAKQQEEEEEEEDREMSCQDTLINQTDNINNPLINRSSLLFCKPIERLTCATNNNKSNRRESNFISLLDLLNSASHSSANLPLSSHPPTSSARTAVEEVNNDQTCQVDAKEEEDTETALFDVCERRDESQDADLNFTIMMKLLQQRTSDNNPNTNNHPQLPASATTPHCMQTPTATTTTAPTCTTTTDFSETININATVKNATTDDNIQQLHHHNHHHHIHLNHPYSGGEKSLRGSLAVAGGGHSNPPPPNNRLSKCTVCEFEAPSRELLAAHEAAVHIRTKFFRCAKCNYVTHIRTRFSKHVKYHSMPMIKCNLCDFRTPYKWNLDRHMKNHGGSGPFKCSACDFTADIKQSLTVHEMNHHDPPVGSAAATGNLQAAQQQLQSNQRRRNRVGASDGNEQMAEDLASGLSFHFLDGSSMLSEHLKSVDLVEAVAAAAAANLKKAAARPIPNLIPIQGQPPTTPGASTSALNLSSKSLDSRSQHTDSNSETSANEMGMDQDENSNPTSVSSAFKKKHGSFFDKLKEKIGTNGDSTNLTCPCSHVAKCLSELFIHQKSCQKFKQNQMSNKTYSPNLINNKHSSRCQYCRHRCKSSADLVAHMQNCVNAQLFLSNALNVNIEQDSASEADQSEKMMVMDEDGDDDEQQQQHQQQSMENRIFVWNKMPDTADNEAGSATGSEGNNPDLSMFTPQIKQEKMDDLELSLEMHSTFRQSPDSPRTPQQHQPQLMRKGDGNSSACLKKVFKCPHCSFWASTASRFHVHIVGHLNKKPFECSLCAYRSNWRWDITKHIRLKTIRDPGHKTAKVLMNDETGRRNYTKYNKYITLMKVNEGDGNLKLMKSGEMTPNQEASLQSPHDSGLSLPGGGGGGGGGSGSGSKGPSSLTTMQKLLLNDTTSANLLKLSQGGFSAEDLLASGTDLSALLLATQQQAFNDAAASAGGEKKPTTFKCKRCHFKHPNRAVVHEHVKSHYGKVDQHHEMANKLANSNNPAVEITPVYNTTNNNIVGGLDANLLLANKSLGNFLVSQLSAVAAGTLNNNNVQGQPNANGIVMSSGGGTVDGNGGLVVVGGGGNNNQVQSLQLKSAPVRAQPPPGLMGLSSSGSIISNLNNNTSCIKILPKAALPQQQANNSNTLMMSMLRKQTSAGQMTTTTATTATTPQVNNNQTNDHGEMDEASSGGTVGHNYRSQLSYRCGHCQQVSNWKHVIQRHCRLKHGGNINIEQIRSQRSAPAGGAQKQTTDSNNVIISNISHSHNASSTPNATATAAQKGLENGVNPQLNSLQSPPPLLAPLLRAAASNPAGNQSKEMQAVQQRFSSLINSISSGVVGNSATEEAAAAAGGSADQGGNRKKQYDCAHCSYVTDNKSQFSYHKSLHKPIAGEELKCSYCNYATSKRMLLTQHMRIHQSNPDDVIVVESENHSVFPKGGGGLGGNSSDLEAEDEERLVRTGKENRNKENQGGVSKRRKTDYMCPFCPYSDANSELVNDHKQFHFGVSGERLKFSCEFCDFNAHSEKTMKDHRKLHFSFLEKGNAAAVEFCTTYDKLKLFVATAAATAATSVSATRSAGPSKDKKIYDEEEIEDENPWMHSANTSSSSSATAAAAGAGVKLNTSGQSNKGLSKGGRGAKNEAGGKAAINV